MITLGTLKISEEVPDSVSPQKTANCTVSNCVGRLWIFYSDVRQVEQWGTINGEDSKINQYEKDVICRQLGYEAARPSIIEPHKNLTNNSVPVWLTGIDCGDQPGSIQEYKTNILQCNHSVCYGCTDHSTDLLISCRKCIYTYTATHKFYPLCVLVWGQKIFSQ